MARPGLRLYDRFRVQGTRRSAPGLVLAGCSEWDTMWPAVARRPTEVSMTTIVILGGYGNTGREVVRLLLEHTDAQVVLAGRDADKAARAAAGWNGRFPGTRVRSARADAGQAGSLAALFAGADLVVVASSSSAHVKIVAAAALEAGIDYKGSQVSGGKVGRREGRAP